MQSYCLEPAEDMKDTDQKWVQTEIKTEIHQHLDPRGWRKLLAYLPLIGILGIFITLLGLAGAGWNYGLTRMGQEATFQAHTTDTLKIVTDRLTSIEGKLGILQAQTAITKLSAIPVKELKKHRDELVDVKRSLAGIPPETTNYWPASFQIITLLSQAMHQLETIGRQPLTELDNVSISGFGTRGGLLNGQNVLLKNRIEGFSFENSVIHFDASTKLINVQFTHCVFIFPADSTPPKSLQDIGATLLASDLEHVKITAS